MLDRIDPEELPTYAPIVAPAESDVANFRDIYGVAVRILDGCVRKAKEPKVGWSIIGTSLDSWVVY